MQPLLPVFIAFEQALADEAADKVGGAQLRQQAGVEGDFVHAIIDLLRRHRNLFALDRAHGPVETFGQLGVAEHRRRLV